MVTMRRKISEEQVYQSFNLKTLLGQTPSQAQKELFYELAVEKMVDRTTSGNDINGNRFKPYSPQYAEQKGVDVNSVDLILNGDMLDGFKEGSTKNIVRIEMQSDQTEKAYGHITGMKGHPTIKKGKVRDFFGFKDKKDLDDIVSQVKSIAPTDPDAPVERENLEMFDLAELRAAVQEIDLDFGDL